ncbi:MAG: glycosyltransferase, partial [Thermohalobaculum sp.]|nr:glycosyltransferase [Thermohalobaculum sp.]
MKVLHVIPSLAPARGGPSTALPLFERALAAEGVTVETATTDDDGPGRRSPRPPETVEGGIRRLWFPKQAEFYTRSAPFRRWIGAHVRDYDLVHVHALFSHVSVSAALAARRAGVPYVIRPCGALTRYGMATKPLMKRVSLALFEARALRGAAAVQVTSEQERDEALELGVPMRPWLLPLGIDDPGAGRAERFLARHPDACGRPRLLFLSRLHPKKNLEAAIDALALLGDGPAAPVLIVCGEGEADYRRALAARAAGRGVAGRIVWAGFVTGADKADALAAGDLFVLPSFSENFGIAAVEALFAGLPCVL